MAGKEAGWRFTAAASIDNGSLLSLENGADFNRRSEQGRKPRRGALGIYQLAELMPSPLLVLLRRNFSIPGRER